MRELSNSEITAVHGAYGDAVCGDVAGVSACATADGVTVTGADGSVISFSTTDNGVIGAVTVSANGVSVSCGVTAIASIMGCSVVGVEAALAGASLAELELIQYYVTYNANNP